MEGFTCLGNLAEGGVGYCSGGGVLFTGRGYPSQAQLFFPLPVEADNYRDPAMSILCMISNLVQEQAATICNPRVCRRKSCIFNSACWGVCFLR